MNLDNLTPEEIAYLRAMAFKDKDYATTLQRMLGVADDGIFGKKSTKALQDELGVKADGKFGKKSKQAFNTLLDEQLVEATRHNMAKERGNVEWTNSFYDMPEEQGEYNRKFEYPRLALVNKEIEDLKKQIAERKAKQAPQPNTRVGWASYIIDGDRGLLDKYADAERAWNLQQESQRHAEALADKQHKQQAMYQMDENMKLRNAAAIKYQGAVNALEVAKATRNQVEIDKAQMNLDLAKNELDYYNKRVGYNGTTKSEDVNNNSDNKVDGESVAYTLETANGIKRFKTRQEKANYIKQLKALDPDGQNTNIAKAINRLSGLDTDEDKADRRKSWEVGTKLKGYDLREWADKPENKKLLKEFGAIGGYTGA
jgi:hypothetical protein